MAATRSGKRSGAVKTTASKPAKTTKATKSNKAATKEISLGSATREAPEHDDTETSPISSDGTSERVSAEIWMKYKDDLPNAFNGDVDTDRDFISKMPAEILEEIASYCLLDHEPERALHHKQHPGLPHRPHALLSLAAMSQPMYHAVEGFAARFIRMNRAQMHLREKPVDKTCRRSARLASKPQLKGEAPVHRRELLDLLAIRCVFCFDISTVKAVMSNMNTVCTPCQHKHLDSAELITKTQALERFDLKDYHLLKSRKPGPRTKPVDHLPPIAYGVTTYRLSIPPYVEVTSYFFRKKDLSALAVLVHGDVKKHMAEKADKKIERADRARRKRVREVLIEWHKEHLEKEHGSPAQWRVKALKRYADVEWDEDDEDGAFLDDLRACPDLCRRCVDVHIRGGCVCECCYEDDFEKRWDDFYYRRYQAARES